jgi:hypothetical protein
MVNHRVSGMHDLDTQLRMPRQQIFEQKRVAFRAAKPWRGDDGDFCDG